MVLPFLDIQSEVFGMWLRLPCSLSISILLALSVIPFYCQVPVQCVDILHFVCPPTDDGHWDFQFDAIMNNVAIELLLRSFVCVFL